MLTCRDLIKPERLFGVWDSQSGQGQKFEGRFRSKQEMGVAFKSEKQSVWALVFRLEKNRKWVWFPGQEKTENS